ncbi:MAG: hypothetical protein FJ146_03730 [Deltaproteobacteria bacterium]|nr:hypothetical protein [Deltaproteobacteria bacterium]
MIKKSGTKSSTIQVKQTEDGLHLADSILWFDAQANGELSFISTPDLESNPKVPQVIATAETVRILEAFRRKPNALVCQYNRPFSIGRLRMELLPSGCVLGGASLYVEVDGGRLLYAPNLQPQRVPTVRQMQLKKAHTLVLAPTQADPNLALPNRKREKDRLLETVQSMVKHGVYPIILCDPVGTAQEITKLLTDHEIPVAVHDVIAKINKVYEDSGSKIGPYTRFTRKYAKQKVTLIPIRGHIGNSRVSNLPEAPILGVQGVLDETISLGSSRQVAERFVLGTSFDGPEMRDIITAVGPKEVYVMGQFAKRYAAELANIGVTVKPLFVNDQPTLF